MNKKKNQIEVFYDPSCEMAKVLLNDVLVMDGNYWDFHPECHGITKYGDWNSYTELARAISRKLGDNNCEITTKTYKYEQY